MEDHLLLYDRSQALGERLRCLAVSPTAAWPLVNGVRCHVRRSLGPSWQKVEVERSVRGRLLPGRPVVPPCSRPRGGPWSTPMAAACPDSNLAKSGTCRREVASGSPKYVEPSLDDGEWKTMTFSPK